MKVKTTILFLDNNFPDTREKILNFISDQYDKTIKNAQTSSVEYNVYYDTTVHRYMIDGSYHIDYKEDHADRGVRPIPKDHIVIIHDDIDSEIFFPEHILLVFPEKYSIRTFMVDYWTHANTVFEAETKLWYKSKLSKALDEFITTAEGI